LESACRSSTHLTDLLMRLVCSQGTICSSDEMNRRLLSLLFVSISWLTATSAGPNEPKLTPERFASLHALISSHPGEEKWLEIHWLTNLTEARHQAETQNKPILLWEMDGNPLGCT
jgi:hypothetical protein